MISVLPGDSGSWVIKSVDMEDQAAEGLLTVEVIRTWHAMGIYCVDIRRRIVHSP